MVRFLAGFASASAAVFVWNRWSRPWLIYLFSRGDH